jgi:hypothetical protein
LFDDEVPPSNGRAFVRNILSRPKLEAVTTILSDLATVSATGISEFAGPPFFQKLRGKRREYDCAVVANRFDRASFHRFFAECFLFRGFWLFVNVGMTAVVIAFETGGCRFAAQIAVDALIVDVEFSCYVFGVFVCDLSHSFYGKGEVQC